MEVIVVVLLFWCAINLFAIRDLLSSIKAQLSNIERNTKDALKPGTWR